MVTNAQKYENLYILYLYQYNYISYLKSKYTPIVYYLVQVATHAFLKMCPNVLNCMGGKGDWDTIPVLTELTV